jgi:hypothetical protein
MDGLPARAEADLAWTLRDIAADALAAQRRDAPVKTGSVKGALSIAEVLDRLKVRIGLIGPSAKKYFYARIIEYGRRAQVVRVIRRKFRSVGRSRRRAAGVAASYALRVKAMAPRPFVRKDRPDLDELTTRRLAEFWSRTLDNIGASG